MRITRVAPVTFRRVGGGHDLLIHVTDASVETAKVRVRLADQPDRFLVEATVPVPFEDSGDIVVDLGAAEEFSGDGKRAHVEVQDASLTVHLRRSRPDDTLLITPFFHYDPVWWNTQAGYTSEWEHQPDAQQRRKPFQKSALMLVREHLRFAEVHPSYKFVLSEVDYIHPFLTQHPEMLPVLKELAAQGRLEIAGGAWNEPNTNLVAPATTRANLTQGQAYFTAMLGAPARTGWQLDAFGHDPAYPAIAAQHGLRGVWFARGPHHHWGIVPHGTPDFQADISTGHLDTEFEWVAPSGESVIAVHLVNHYPRAWPISFARDAEDAFSRLWRLDATLRPSASGPEVSLPFGTDNAPPSIRILEAIDTWTARYITPSVQLALPSTFIDRVAAREELLLPQSRDMNPVYSGKEVSFADTKRAHRSVENLLLSIERATVAAAAKTAEDQTLSRVIREAWRALAFASHHDAITGTESDQVYIDLLALWQRTDHTLRVHASRAGAIEPHTARQNSHALVAERIEHDEFTVRVGDTAVTFAPRTGNAIVVANLAADPASMLRKRGVGNVLVAFREYPDHPAFAEGPWNLLPTGDYESSLDSDAPATVQEYQDRVEVSSRVRVRGWLIEQVVIIRAGDAELDCRVLVLEPGESDTLLRVRWDFETAGRRPVFDTAAGPIARCFGNPWLDTADNPWTLDSSCHQWFGLSSLVTVQHCENVHTIGVVEIVVDEQLLGASFLARTRALVTALGAAGITATVTRLQSPRYGNLQIDSNLPDLRILLVAETTPLPLPEPGLGATFRPALPARVGWEADVTGWKAIHLLMARGTVHDVDDMMSAWTDSLATRRTILVDDQNGHRPPVVPPASASTVAILNRGTPGGLVEPDGTAWLSLMRSTTGWPSGVWIDRPVRRTPDGDMFSQQRWGHRIDYLVAQFSSPKAATQRAHDYANETVWADYAPQGDVASSSAHGTDPGISSPPPPISRSRYWLANEGPPSDLNLAQSAIIRQVARTPRWEVVCASHCREELSGELTVDSATGRVSLGTVHAAPGRPAIVPLPIDDATAEGGHVVRWNTPVGVSVDHHFPGGCSPVSMMVEAQECVAELRVTAIVENTSDVDLFVTGELVTPVELWPRITPGKQEFWLRPRRITRVHWLVDLTGLELTSWVLVKLAGPTGPLYSQALRITGLHSAAPKSMKVT